MLEFKILSLVMFNNGCLRSKVMGDPIRMIGELLNKKKWKFDYIVIETTNM